MSTPANYVAERASAHLTQAYEVKRTPLNMERLPYAIRPGDFENYTPGANEMVINVVDYRGDSSVMASAATTAKAASVKRDAHVANVTQFGLEALYDYGAVLQAQATGRDIPQEEVRSAFLGITADIDTHAFAGGNGAVSSFARDTNVHQLTELTDNERFTAATTNALRQAVQGHLHELISAVDSRSDSNFSCTHVALPAAAYNAIAGMYLEGSSTSVLNQAREAYDVTFLKVPGLKNRGDTSGDSRAVAFDSDPEAGRLVHTLIQQFNVRNYETHFEVPFRAKSAGFIWVDALACAYLDNVSPTS